MAFAEELKEPEACSDCQQKLVTRVQQSNAGYYLGTWCGCGPYARLSDYFATREEAQAELELWQQEGVRPHGRTTGFWPGA